MTGKPRLAGRSMLWRAVLATMLGLGAMPFLGVGPAHALVSVVTDFPTPVTVGQTNLPASLTIANGAGVTLTTITLVPSCAIFTDGCPGGFADPGTFTISPTGSGTGGADACTGRTFNIVVVNAATGEVEFQPVGGSIVLQQPSPGNDLDTCAIGFTVSVNRLPNHDSSSSPGIQTNQIGRVTGTHQSGIDIAKGSDVTTVLQATPTLVTAATPTAGVGQPITDTATLADGSNPTGTITFTLFGPNNPTCTGGPVFTDPVAVAGNGQYTSGPFAAAAPGTYHWVAVYSGDANNLPVTSPCGASNEVSTVLGPADLSVAKTCPAGPVPPGTVVVCTVSVSNAGPSPAQNVMVIDDLPAGATLVGTPSGGGFMCGEGDPFVCTLPSLAPHTSAMFTFSVRLPGDAAPGGSVTNAATVSSASPDPGPGANTATATTAIVTCTITGAGDITGTDGDDVICGSAGPDRIAGLGGNDTILGLGGDDMVSGGEGNDVLHGGTGSDRLTGGNGNDQIFGGGGGVDRLSGDAGDDYLNTVDGSADDFAVGGVHVSGDVCAGDGDALALCEA